jgi:hypothetical protein
MEKTGYDPKGEYRRPLFLAIILFVALLMSSATFLILRTIFPPLQTREEARREALCKADRLALYSSVGFLEEQRHQSVADLTAGVRIQTNVNGALVHLLAESQMSFPVRISNFAGSDMFVDPWGLPYRFTIAKNVKTPRTPGRHIERGISIEKGHRP